MAIGAGERLAMEIRKGYRSLYEAQEDQRRLVEEEWTGVSWRWVDRQGHEVAFSY